MNKTPFARLTAPVAVLVAFLLALFLGKQARSGREEGERPADWFFRQRAYPQGFIDADLRRTSITQARQLLAATRSRGIAYWQPRGPSNIGGRITALAISRQNPNVIYAGGADGGVLKSTNSGVNWTPLFDDQISLSIGALAVDPTNDNIIYVGTGEANSSGDSYDGFGVVKSTNRGVSWFPLGLEQTRHIGKIVVDPLNPATVYVAAMGALFSPNPARGVYKSTNAGTTWNRILSVNDSTGVVDLSMHPLNPNILFAASWQRMRAPWGRRYVGGVSTGIYRTTNAGTSWFLLSNGLPVAAPNVGRPGIAIAPSNPSVAYVAYADDPGYFLGVYKTTNGGDMWTRTNDSQLNNLYSNFGWYFGNVFVAPSNENAVFVCGVPMGRTTNGGASWTTVNTSHVDQHALVFHPTDPNIMYVGNDGGFCRSTNGGLTWTSQAYQDLFITQFYAGAIDYLNSPLSMGGTQDNGTIRTLTGEASNWHLVNGGDGFYSVIDYRNSSHQYAESQYGGLVRTTNNWGSMFDATAGINPSDRKNWSTPIIMDPNNPQVLYTGTQRLYKTTNRAQSWFAVSGDLTHGPLPNYPAYATITTIDVAKADSSCIMVGTDDANVWVTTNGGSTWADVSTGLPNRWITRVRFDPISRTTAYVTLSGYRIDSRLPHVFRTTNLGVQWQDISSNLPEAPVSVILVDPAFTDRLYVGTDVGAFFTTNGGAAWFPMGSGLPNVVISDMVLHPPTRIARAFTHGRSIWEIDLDQLIVTGIAEAARSPASFRLYQNYPNPFNPSTTIGFRLSDVSASSGQAGEQGHVSMRVYDVTGSEVAILVNEELRPGRYERTFDGRTLASGVYIVRLRVGGREEVRKMLLLR